MCDFSCSLDPRMRDCVCARVILAGGIANCSNVRARLVSELRKLLLDSQEIHVESMPCPELAAFRGGSLLAASPVFESVCVSKWEWQEYGSAICADRFANAFYDLRTTRSV